MPNAEPSIFDDVENAMRTGSAQKRLETIKRVADLFLASAGRLNTAQVELFDDVLQRLIETVELRAVVDVSARIALAELSLQLAPVTKAPPAVVRRLARHDEITVAGPVLTESARLSAEDLVEIAKTKSEQHLLAISGRWWLKEAVTDALLGRRYLSVCRRIVTNPGARVSANGFAIVVALAASDAELAVQAGIRVDLPSPLRQQLLRGATEAVRSNLLARASPQVCEEIRTVIAAVAAEAKLDVLKVRDFTAAKRLVASLHDRGQLNEAALLGFAKQREYEITVVALAQLSQSTVELVRSLMQSPRADGLMVPCKVAGLDWETVHAVLESRFSAGSLGSREASEAKAQFAKMTPEHARSLLRNWQHRATSVSSNTH